MQRIETTLICLCLITMFCFSFACPSFAEELEPRRWSHLPINTNFFGG